MYIYIYIYIHIYVCVYKYTHIPLNVALLSFSVPPYGYGGAMYLRPFLFGHGEKLGLGAAPHFSFCIIASPVGAYYKGGASIYIYVCI